MKKIGILLFILFLCLLPSRLLLADSETIEINATVVSLCGNGVINTGEQCDSTDLGGQTCVSRGFLSGTLSCNFGCVFNTNACNAGSSGGGNFSGGGGGGGSLQTAVNFSGKAYPKSTVTLLKDAQVAASTIADADADFSFSLSGLSGGNYIFSIYSEDSKGNRSSLLTFPVGVIFGSTSTIGNVFIAPTLAVDKSEVKQGDALAIFGQTAPSGEVSITVNSDTPFFAKIIADKSGAYLYNLDTSDFEMGQHYTKSKTALSGSISSFSKSIGFLAGTKTVLAQSQIQTINSDVNGDRKVNLVDFSIAAYWYKRSSPPDSVDLNSDGVVNLVDFSIMAFYWTG